MQYFRASLLGTEEGDNIENIENISNTMQQPNRGGYLPAYPGQPINSVSSDISKEDFVCIKLGKKRDNQNM